MNFLAAPEGRIIVKREGRSPNAGNSTEDNPERKPDKVEL